MPSRKRLASSPISRRPARAHRKECPAYDNGSDGEEFDDSAEDDDYRPDVEEGKSEKDNSPTPENNVEEEGYPNRITIIPYEKLLPLDGVEYSDIRVHKNTLLYLNDLRVSNNRDWFKSKNATPPKCTAISNARRP
jgi:hypothetical protein